MKFKYNILVLLVFCFVAAGCKMGENYTRPDFGTPDAFYTERGKDSVGTDARDSIYTANLKWKEFFKDPVLVSLIDTALVNNIAIKKAMKDIEINFQSFQEAKVNFLPSLNATPAGYIQDFHSENYYSSPNSNYYGNTTPPRSFYTQKLQHFTRLNSSWELNVWGKFSRQREASLAEFMQSQEFKKAVQTYIVAEIAASYYNLLMLKSQLEIAKTNLELNNNTLSILHLQYTAGEVTSLAVQQVESQKLRAESLIPRIEREYSIEENYLNSLLGRFPQEITLDLNLDEIEPETLYSTGVPLELINNRPDVAGAEYSLIAANAKVGIAESLKYPSLRINATLGMDAVRLKNLFDPVGSGLTLLNASVFQPIFQNRRLKTNHKIAIAQKEKAELDFKEKLITAVSEVSNSLVTIEKLKDEYAIAEERFAIAHKSVDNASLLFKSGLANYLEVLTAQSNALDSELNLANIKMQILLANVELYRSLGGGWQ